MSDSVYRVTEVIGTSASSWEAAAQNATGTIRGTVTGAGRIVPRPNGVETA